MSVLKEAIVPYNTVLLQINRDKKFFFILSFIRAKFNKVNKYYSFCFIPIITISSGSRITQIMYIW